MSSSKKSFILYADLIHTVKKLSKERAGELFMAILSEVNGEEMEVADEMVDLVFDPIKRQLARDSKRWDEVSEKRKQAANARWEMQKDANASKSSDLHYDTVNDTVTVTDNGSDNVSQKGKEDGNLIQQMIFVWKQNFPTHIITKDSIPHLTTLRGMLRTYIAAERRMGREPIPDEWVVDKLKEVCMGMSPFWKEKISLSMIAKESNFNSIMGELTKKETVIAHDPRNRRQ